MGTREGGKGGEHKKGRRKYPKRGGANERGIGRGGGGGEALAKGRSKSRRSVITAVVNEGKFIRKRAGNVNRPKWAAPEAPALALPALACVWCEKPIRELSTAVCDPETGKAGHFDCAVNRLAETERLDKDDKVIYIGSGRFGVIGFANPQNPKKFKIKKVLEWETAETRSEWRVNLCDHFSVT